MGLLIASLLAIALGIALWRHARPQRGVLQLLGAGLLLAMAGYALQGRPTLAGSPAQGNARPDRGDTEFARTRDAVLGRFDRASMWLTMADSYMARGDMQNAAGLLGTAVRRNPRNPDLWTGFGYALVMQSERTVTPAAELAFARAARLAPDHPGPKFYRALALAQADRFEEAEAIWSAMLATAPPQAEWRPLVVERLALVRRIRAMVAGQEPGAGEAPPQ